MFVVVIALFAIISYFLCILGNGACSSAQMYNKSELKESEEDEIICFPYAGPHPNDIEDAPHYLFEMTHLPYGTKIMKSYSYRTMNR